MLFLVCGIKWVRNTFWKYDKNITEQHMLLWYSYGCLFNSQRATHTPPARGSTSKASVSLWLSSCDCSQMNKKNTEWMSRVTMAGEKDRGTERTSSPLDVSHKPNEAKTQKSTWVTLTSPAGVGFCRVQIQHFTHGGKANVNTNNAALTKKSVFRWVTWWGVNGPQSQAGSPKQFSAGMPNLTCLKKAKTCLIIRDTVHIFQIF